MEQQEKIFSQRLSFYGKSLAIYIIVLLVFIAFRSAIIDGEITIVLHEPVILLMLIVIAITSLVLLTATIRKRQIIFGTDYLIFRNRFVAKKYNFSEISSIKIMRSPSKVVNSAASIIRIKFKNRKKIFIIRTAAYIDDIEMLNKMHELRLQIKKIN